MSKKSGLDFLGSTEGVIGDGTMIKATHKPEGVQIDVAIPRDEEEVGMLLEAVCAVMLSTVLQLEKSGKICHAGCAYLHITRSATAELRELAPEAYAKYHQELEAMVRRDAGDKVIDKILTTAAEHQHSAIFGKVPPKKDWS